MSSTTVDSLEELIREAGEGHLIDWFAPKASALPHLRRLLADANSRAQELLGNDAPRLTPEQLSREYSQNPHKVRAFLQVLSSASPDMLVMVWRLLQGMSIASLRLEYDAERDFDLTVELTSPSDPAHHERYRSTDIDDAVVLRHLGTIKMNGKPLFDGFYALNLS